MITEKNVEYVADLARLKLSGEERAAFTGQLSSIVGYIDQLNSVDTEQVSPTALLSPDHNPLRDDSARPSLEQQQVLVNAPRGKRGFFAVPKVIGS